MNNLSNFHVKIVITRAVINPIVMGRFLGHPVLSFSAAVFFSHCAVL